MAEILTHFFGRLDVDENHVLDFPSGLPGFDHQTRFLLVERPAAAPVVFLQSLDTPSLCFLAAPMDSIDAQYELAITPDDLRLLGFDQRRVPRPGAEVLCLAILAAPENGPMTANLLAPVVVDLRTRRAVQAVRVDSRYSHQHRLESRESACS